MKVYQTVALMSKWHPECIETWWNQTDGVYACIGAMDECTQGGDGQIPCQAVTTCDWATAAECNVKRYSSPTSCAVPHRPFSQLSPWLKLEMSSQRSQTRNDQNCRAWWLLTASHLGWTLDDDATVLADYSDTVTVTILPQWLWRHVYLSRCAVTWLMMFFWLQETTHGLE